MRNQLIEMRWYQKILIREGCEVGIPITSNVLQYRTKILDAGDGEIGVLYQWGEWMPVESAVDYEYQPAANGD
jgi:hypothetical protein